MIRSSNFEKADEVVWSVVESSRKTSRVVSCKYHLDIKIYYSRLLDSNAIDFGEDHITDAFSSL